MQLLIHTDGASRGNPGLASYGFIIQDGQGLILHQEGKYLGTATNNVAEYMAVLSALEYVDHHLKGSPHQIKMQMDSLLIVQQMKGVYKIKHPNLIPLYQQIQSLLPKLGDITFEHVPRAKNFIADRLANIAIDQALAK